MAQSIKKDKIWKVSWKVTSILIQAYVTGQACEVNPKKSARGNVEHEEAFWNFTLVKTRKGDLTLILSFYTETSIKFYWNFDLAHSKPMSQSKTRLKVWSEYPHGVKNHGIRKGGHS